MSDKQEPALQPTETYKGVPIYLFQDDNMKPGEYGASFLWAGHTQTAQVEHWQRPTRANILQAAHKVIGLLREVEHLGMLESDGTLKAEG
jgi:hypothetical protein